MKRAPKFGQREIRRMDDALNAGFGRHRPSKHAGSKKRRKRGKRK